MARGLLDQWRDVTPFAIQSSDQFRSDPPPALTSNKYRKDNNEVKKVGELNSMDRPQDRTDVARYFTVGAVHAWNQAASQVSAAQGKSLSKLSVGPRLREQRSAHDRREHLRQRRP